MQYLNDDMDELFRRAGENYPLKVDNPNWNKVKDALSENPKPNKNKNSNSRWIFFVPLLFFWTLNTFISYREGNINNKLNNDQDKVYSDQVVKTATEKFPPAVSLNKERRISNKDQYTYLNNNIPLKESNNSVIIPDKKYIHSIDKVLNSDNNIDLKRNYSTLQLSEKDKHFSFLQIGKILRESEIQIKPLGIERSSLVTIQSTAKEKIAKRTKNFYAGITAGIDKSTIKYQTLSDYGFTMGVILGYSFNSKFSVESGAFYDKKSYYSDGKYFKSKIYNYNDLYSVDGICHMIEIPLNVKYNFSTGKRSSLFSELGLSSYLMKNENYNYLYYWSGQLASASKSYTNSSHNWFSIISISAGYQHKIGINYNFRIEPYFKVPLNGVGIGQLPITSFGLNIGITRPVF